MVDLRVDAMTSMRSARPRFQPPMAPSGHSSLAGRQRLGALPEAAEIERSTHDSMMPQILEGAVASRSQMEEMRDQLAFVSRAVNVLEVERNEALRTAEEMRQNSLEFEEESRRMHAQMEKLFLLAQKQIEELSIERDEAVDTADFYRRRCEQLEAELRQGQGDVARIGCGSPPAKARIEDAIASPPARGTQLEARLRRLAAALPDVSRAPPGPRDADGERAAQHESAVQAPAASLHAEAKRDAFLHKAVSLKDARGVWDAQGEQRSVRFGASSARCASMAAGGAIGGSQRSPHDEWRRGDALRWKGFDGKKTGVDTGSTTSSADSASTLFFHSTA
mmetsp:Transcript_67972/g.196933  ORF Transcript_67972/g.196933 Transcript_67972/m.196933 type:complete len:336 (-) Transcript_67972:183-1190(-)